VTGADGQYQILSLPPGVYGVTFTLTGFNTVRRQGIELVAGFTATVNGDLAVGSVAETITVSGQSPVVDIRSTTQLRTVGRTLIDSLPAKKIFASMAVLIPGVPTSTASISRQDVGGSSGERVPQLTLHGSRPWDSPRFFNGMSSGSVIGTGGWA